MSRRTIKNFGIATPRRNSHARARGVRGHADAQRAQIIGAFMICIEPGVYVRVFEMPNGPMPRPLGSGFSMGVAYRVLGIFSPSETSEGFCVLVNDRDETWYVSDRHFKVEAVRNDLAVLRLNVDEIRPRVMRAVADSGTYFAKNGS